MTSPKKPLQTQSNKKMPPSKKRRNLPGASRDHDSDDGASQNEKRARPGSQKGKTSTKRKGAGAPSARKKKSLFANSRAQKKNDCNAASEPNSSDHSSAKSRSSNSTCFSMTDDPTIDNESMLVQPSAPDVSMRSSKIVTFKGIWLERNGPSMKTSASSSDTVEETSLSDHRGPIPNAVTRDVEKSPAVLNEKVSETFTKTLDKGDESIAKQIDDEGKAALYEAMDYFLMEGEDMEDPDPHLNRMGGGSDPEVSRPPPVNPSPEPVAIQWRQSEQTRTDTKASPDEIRAPTPHSSHVNDPDHPELGTAAKHDLSRNQHLSMNPLYKEKASKPTFTSPLADPSPRLSSLKQETSIPSSKDRACHERRSRQARYTIIKSRYPRLRKLQWSNSSLKSHSVYSIFSEISRLGFRPNISCIGFNLILSTHDEEYRINAGDEAGFRRMQDDFMKRMIKDVSVNPNADLVVEIEPDPVEVEMTATRWADEDTVIIL